MTTLADCIKKLNLPHDSKIPDDPQGSELHVARNGISILEIRQNMLFNNEFVSLNGSDFYQLDDVDYDSRNYQSIASIPGTDQYLHIDASSPNNKLYIACAEQVKTRKGMVIHDRNWFGLKSKTKPTQFSNTATLHMIPQSTRDNYKIYKAQDGSYIVMYLPPLAFEQHVFSVSPSGEAQELDIERTEVNPGYLELTTRGEASKMTLAFNPTIPSRLNGTPLDPLEMSDDLAQRLGLSFDQPDSSYQAIAQRLCP